MAGIEWRRMWDRFIQGTERLGHQTQFIKERVHRTMVFICVVVCAIGSSLGLLMVCMVYLALHTGDPARFRAQEVGSTVPDLASDIAYRRFTTKRIPAECQQPVFHKCLVNETFPAAPRIDEWGRDGTAEDANATGRPWFFLRAASACFEWTPEVLCPDSSPALFPELEECLRDCGARGVPSWRCTRHLTTPLPPSNCSLSEEDAGHWWFYDPWAHACRNWTNVCVRPAFTSYRACTRRCKPRRHRSRY